jgi:hypothetical protein
MASPPCFSGWVAVDLPRVSSTTFTSMSRRNPSPLPILPQRLPQ